MNFQKRYKIRQENYVRDLKRQISLKNTAKLVRKIVAQSQSPAKKWKSELRECWLYGQRGKLFEDSRMSEKLEAAKDRNDSSPSKSNATLGSEESVTSPERELRRKDQLVEKLSRRYATVS